MACCVYPGVVNRAILGPGFLINLLENFDLLSKTFGLVIDRSNRWQDGEGASLLPFAYV